MKKIMAFLLTALLCFSSISAYAASEKPCVDITFGYALLSENELTSSMGLSINVYGAADISDPVKLSISYNSAVLRASGVLGGNPESLPAFSVKNVSESEIEITIEPSRLISSDAGVNYNFAVVSQGDLQLQCDISSNIDLSVFMPLSHSINYGDLPKIELDDSLVTDKGTFLMLNKPSISADEIIASSDYCIVTPASSGVNDIDAIAGTASQLLAMPTDPDCKSLPTGSVIYAKCGEGVSDRKILVLPGDADCDGKITASDARLVLRASADLENLPSRFALYACDLNGDMKASSTEARIILRYSASLVSFSELLTEIK